jgi:hypothetical protein
MVNYKSLPMVHSILGEIFHYEISRPNKEKRGKLEKMRENPQKTWSLKWYEKIS